MGIRPKFACKVHNIVAVINLKPAYRAFSFSYKDIPDIRYIIIIPVVSIKLLKCSVSSQTVLTQQTGCHIVIVFVSDGLFAWKKIRRVARNSILRQHMKTGNQKAPVYQTCVCRLWKCSQSQNPATEGNSVHQFSPTSKVSLCKWALRIEPIYWKVHVAV